VENLAINREYSRGQIMATVWGTDFSGDSRAADMQIRNIREKIEPEPKNPPLRADRAGLATSSLRFRPLQNARSAGTSCALRFVSLAR
jgi:hypothetical protein